MISSPPATLRPQRRTDLLMPIAGLAPLLLKTILIDSLARPVLAMKHTASDGNAESLDGYMFSYGDGANDDVPLIVEENTYYVLGFETTLSEMLVVAVLIWSAIIGIGMYYYRTLSDRLEAMRMKRYAAKLSGIDQSVHSETSGHGMLGESTTGASRRSLGFSGSGRQFQQDAMMTSMSGHSMSGSSSRAGKSKATGAKAPPLIAELAAVAPVAASPKAADIGSLAFVAPSSGTGAVPLVSSSAAAGAAAAVTGGKKPKSRKLRGRTIEEDDDDDAFL